MTIEANNLTKWFGDQSSSLKVSQDLSDGVRSVRIDADVWGLPDGTLHLEVNDLEAVGKFLIYLAKMLEEEEDA